MLFHGFPGFLVLTLRGSVAQNATMRFMRFIVGVSVAGLFAGGMACAAPAGQAPLNLAIVLTPPEATAVDAVQAVASALRNGDPNTAVRLANLALDRHDLTAADRIELLLNRGLAHEQRGESEPALADFGLALDEKAMARETRARALFDRGVTLDETGQTAKAIADYTAALSLTPRFAAALNNRANAYRRLGRFAEARRDYEASLASDNSEPQYSDYGLGLLAEAQGDRVAALSYYRKALAIDPDYALAGQRLAALGAMSPRQSVVLRSPEPKSQTAPASYGAVDPLPGLRPAILDRSLARAQVQLGAFRGEADAASRWNAVVVQARGLLRGLTPQIVAVDLPGRGRFYRLRAGQLDRAGAAALCTRLKARKLACFPVTR